MIVHMVCAKVSVKIKNIHRIFSLVLLLAVLSARTSHADDLNSFSDSSNIYYAPEGERLWITLSTKSLRGTTENQIREIFSEYSELAKYDPERYSEVEVFVSEKRWVGKSVCAPDDPRLIRNQISYTLTGKVLVIPNGGMSAGASGKKAGPLPARDPCLFAH